MPCCSHSPRRKHVRPHIEILEDRAVPCTINWINEAGGLWHVPANWDLERVPGAADDVCIADFKGNLAVTHAQGSDTVRSLTNAEALVLSGGSLSLAEDSALANLTLSNGTLTGAGNLSITGRGIWTGGTMSGTGTTRLEAGGELNLTGGGVTLGRNFDNAGTVAVIGPSSVLTLAAGTVFNNLADSLFDIRNDQTVGGNGIFNNQQDAILRRSTSGGIARLAAPTNNDGTVELVIGDLEFNGTGNHLGGFIGAAGTRFRFAGTHRFEASATVTASRVDFYQTTATFQGTYEVSLLTVIVDATVTFTPTAVVNTAGENLHVGNATTDFSSGDQITTRQLTLAGGRIGGIITGSDDITVTGLLTWHAGRMDGSGTTTVTGELEINPLRVSFGTVLTRTLNNGGQGRLIGEFGSGHFSINGAGVFNNLPGAVFDARGNEFDVRGNGRFNNQAGALVRFLIWIDRYLWLPVLNNSGTVEVQQGNLELANGGSHSGSFLAAPGTLLQFTGGTHDFLSTSSISAAHVHFGSGSANLSGAYEVSDETYIGNGVVTFNPSADVSNVGTLLTIRAGIVNFNSGEPLVPSRLVQTGGTLAGSDELYVLDSFIWSGGSQIGSGTTYAFGEVALTGSGMTLGRTLVNFGTATWTGVGPMFASPGAVFHNAGTFDAQNDQTFASSCQATFYNEGTFQKTASYGTTTLGLHFEDAGTVDVQTGTVNFACQTSPGRGGSGWPRSIGSLGLPVGQDLVAALLRRERITF